MNGLMQTTGWPAVVACVGNWFGKGKWVLRAPGCSPTDNAALDSFYVLVVCSCLTHMPRFDSTVRTELDFSPTTNETCDQSKKHNCKYIAPGQHIPQPWMSTSYTVNTCGLQTLFSYVHLWLTSQDHASQKLYMWIWTQPGIRSGHICYSITHATLSRVSRPHFSFLMCQQSN